MQKEISSLSQVQSTLFDLAVRFGPKLLVAILILVGGFVVGRWIGNACNRGLERVQLEPPVRQLIVRMARVLVFGLFAIMALQNLGVELLPLIAGLGVAGAGIALATQGVLSNVVAGLTIIFTKPYRVGESIAIVGVDGTVETISLFSTVLRHADQSIVVIPNRKIVGEILHNYGRIRQTEVQVGVSYGADLPRALAAIEQLMRTHPRVLSDPAPQIQIATLGSAAVQISAKPWLAAGDLGAVEGDLNLQMLKVLREAAIELPTAQYEVRLLRPARFVA